MTTTVVKTIGPTGDYSTLSLHEAAAPANYVTADQIWQGQQQGVALTGSTTLLTVAGGTVDATHYYELTTAPGASFRDTANLAINSLLRFDTSAGAAITSSVNYLYTVVSSQDFSRFSNLQVQNSASNGGAFNSTLSGSPTIDINCCKFEGLSTKIFNIYGSGQVVRNSLIDLRGSARAEIASISNGANAVNCTFVYSGTGTKPTVAVSGIYGTPLLKNCALFNVTGVKNGSSTFTITNCYTDVASPPAGCTTTPFSTATFNNITSPTRDFRLAAGSALIDTGQTDSTNAAIDVYGTARPQGSAYDVGCWEYVAAAGLAKRSVHVTRQAVNRASTY